MRMYSLEMTEDTAKITQKALAWYGMLGGAEDKRGGMIALQTAVVLEKATKPDRFCNPRKAVRFADEPLAICRVKIKEGWK